MDMNFIYKAVLTVFGFLLIGCFSDDDGFGRSISVGIKDAITLENKKEYIVGDTIFFELKFSRYVAEEGFDNLLDVYETSNSEVFRYSFGLEKFSDLANNFTRVDIDPKFIIAEQHDLADMYYYYDGYGTVAVLNAAKDVYESKVGVILAESGTFKFYFDNVYLRNGYDYDKINLSIGHSFSENNPIDLEFSVLEQ